MRDEPQQSIFDDTHDDGLDWDGMPEYEHKDMRPHSSLVVHFDTLEDRNEFAKLVGQQLTSKTAFIWHPGLTVENYNARIRYSSDWAEAALDADEEDDTEEPEMIDNDDHPDPDYHIQPPDRVLNTWPASITLDGVDVTLDIVNVDNDGNPLPEAGDEYDMFGIDDPIEVEPDNPDEECTCAYKGGYTYCPLHKTVSPITVALACNENRISESKVEIIDCYEGPRGEDILIFKCPVCKQQHESVRLG